MKSVVKKEKIVGGLLASSKNKKGGKSANGKSKNIEFEIGMYAWSKRSPSSD